MEAPDNNIGLYLREISQVPLLSPQDEVKLAGQIKRGNKKAREKMITANLRLVVKIAHDFGNYGLPLLDLISEGNIGLMKAVERFDPNKGGKLSTYASWWIKQSIKRALANQSKTIRLPVHLVDKIGKIRRVAAQMAEELGHEPTTEELAEELGLPVAKVATSKLWRCARLRSTRKLVPMTIPPLATWWATTVPRTPSKRCATRIFKTRSAIYSMSLTRANARSSPSASGWMVAGSARSRKSGISSV